MYRHLIKHVSIHTISSLFSSLEPLSEMTNEIEEEITIWDADDFVTDLNKQRETLSILQAKSFSNASAEVL